MGGAYSDNTNSSLSVSASSVIIKGNAYVGGLCGHANNIQVKNCSNENSTISATGYISADGVNYAYLGGYVGWGYSVSNCINAVEINYTNIGYCVGGIIGCATQNISACENRAKVSGKERVGGIAGNAQPSGSATYSNLTNSGKVTGAGNSVGGIIGRLYNNIVSQTNFTVTIKLCDNSGDVNGINYVSGLFGYIRCNNDWNSLYSISIYATDLTNTGNVSGNNNVGGLSGYISSDSTSSSLISYSSTGKVTATGTPFDDYFAYNYNVKIS